MTAGELTSREQREQFELLFAANCRQLFGYLVACLRNRQDAEEVFGETSLVLWREFGKFRPEAPFLPWATGIAFNQVRKFRRKRGRNCAFSDALAEALVDDAIALGEELDERRQALAFCLEHLPGRHRGLVDSFYGRRTPAADVAKSWGCSIHTVYKALKETRRRLFQCINRRIGADS